MMSLDSLSFRNSPLAESDIKIYIPGIYLFKGLFYEEALRYTLYFINQNI